MSQNYTRLTLQERFKIEKYLDQKLSISSIAVLLNRNKSTISREVKKFKKRCYDAFISHQIAFEISMNKNYGRSKILSNKKLLKIVHSKLKKRWSPEQISIFLKHNLPYNNLMNVSHETIYFYIYLHSKSHLKKELIDSLRQKKKTRGPARSNESKEIKIIDRISIDERPRKVLDGYSPAQVFNRMIIQQIK